MYSHELQTCDWPRNVICHKHKYDLPLIDTEIEKEASRTEKNREPKSIQSFQAFGKKKEVEEQPEVVIEEKSDQLDEKDSVFVGESTVINPVAFGSNQFADKEEKETLELNDTTKSSTGFEGYAYDYDTDENDFYYISWEDPIYTDYAADNKDTGPKQQSEVVLPNINVLRPPFVRPHLQPKFGTKASKCDADSCLLPDCLCGSKYPPRNLHRRDVPQLVLLTFDDSVNDLNRKLYRDIFNRRRRNPNGCRIKATFYVSHEWTDYSQVQNLYADGHEIASHSISHSFGEQFSKTTWLKEIAGQRELLAAFAGINIHEVRGMRAPYLAIGGNNMYDMLYEANFTYDSSMAVYENKPPPFPYTLDYKLSHDCMIPPCPSKTYPGLWEVPLVMWNDLSNGKCSMADACSNPKNETEVYQLLMNNFNRHYLNNRAPFGLSYHAAWFSKQHHKAGFEAFLDTLTSMDDVWFVTTWQAVQWMKNPVPQKDLEDFEPFQCKKKARPERCMKPHVCNLWHESGVRYMRTCQKCPNTYPWTGNTGISNSLVDKL